MSVLIKGMDMPKGCLQCPFCEAGKIDDYELYCVIGCGFVGRWNDKIKWDHGWRHEKCPLVEVNDLADRDAVMAAIREAWADEEAATERLLRCRGDRLLSNAKSLAKECDELLELVNKVKSSGVLRWLYDEG